MRKAIWVIVLLLIPSGCGISRNVHEREIVWAQIGTPARIVDDREVRVLVPQGDGWVPGRAILRGMVAIDEPTLDYYRDLHRKHGS